MKPGWQTTEFLGFGIAVILSGLILLGVLTPDDADKMQALILEVAAILGVPIASFGYSLSRGNAKKYTVHPDEPVGHVEQAELDLVKEKINTEQAKRRAYESRVEK